MKKRRFGMIFCLVLALAAGACSREDDNFLPDRQPREVSPSAGTRGEVTQVRRVLLMVSGGHNSLSTDLAKDQQEITEGYLPEGVDANTDVLLILSRLKEGYLSTTSVPVLYRLYRGENGDPVRDTLLRWGPEDRLFGGTVLKEALAAMRHRYPAAGYGMVVSSHASGWLPPLYYYDPKPFGDDYEAKDDSGEGDIFFYSARPGLRSIGEDEDTVQGKTEMVEMDLTDFAAAIPIRLDYVVLDCCLSGGVEVAWALRGKADLVAFTQTETLSDGFDYTTMMGRLMGEGAPSPLGVCQDFFDFYNGRSGSMRSATISLVDTRKLSPLAQVCATLFEKYREPIGALSGKDHVQGYFRYHRHYFYDLEDILLKAGIDAGEQAQLSAALSQCVLYKAATPYFMQGTWYGFAINHHCGLSMYLPSMGSEYLDNYYKEKIGWNSATQLVK